MNNPYPAYKPSGVPWLGTMPEHWEVKRGKWLFRKMERPVRDADEVVTCFRDGTVTLRKNRRTEGFTESLQEIGYQSIRKGDLVIHQMDAFAGAVGVSDSDGKGTPVYSVCLPTQYVYSFYFAHIVREMARNQWILALAKGIRERSTDFRYSEFARQLLPLPPLSEQRAIVRYLDYVDRRIRRYISAKQKLVDLLEEEKQAIINQAVTRGLDPNVRLKPSGVEWLGDVPVHWEVSILKWYSSCHSGDGLSSIGISPETLASRCIPVIGGNGLMGFAETGNCMGPVLAIGRVGALCGNVHLIDGPAWITDNALVLSTYSDSVSIEYLALVLKTRNLNETANKTAQPLITGTGVLNERVPIPPRSEQDEITDYLGKATVNKESAIARARRQIELLQEYRTRLIADVVTGNLDVRELAARLPYEDDDGQDPIEGDGLLTEGMDRDLFDADASGEELAMESEVTV